MKKAKSILSFGLLVVLMNSCVYSLFPIYTDDTLVYFPELIGRWEKEGDSNAYVEFSAVPKSIAWLSNGTAEKEVALNSAEEKVYVVEFMDNSEALTFIGHIAEIGNDFFLDLYPAEVSNSSTIPVHTFSKVKFINNRLDLTSFDLEKLNKLFESNLIRLRHENVDGTILITAQPSEIQKFIDRYSEDESVFKDKDTYRRAS